MKYVFDTNSLSSILKFYYPARFPSFWEKFNDMLAGEKICSVREVYHELNNRFEKGELKIFTNQNKDFFSEPIRSEQEFLKKIFSEPQFQESLSKKKRLKGEAFADPFIIAKAETLDATVVTEEKHKENSVRIPNICEHFNIDCCNLEQFLVKEDWCF